MDKKEVMYSYFELYFTKKDDLVLNREITLGEKKYYIEVLGIYSIDNMEKLKNNSKLWLDLIKYIYGIDNDIKAVVQLMKDTQLYKLAGIFSNNNDVSERLKNVFLADLVEKIRFSKLQKESLRDTSTYNRHIAKSLTDMKNDIIVLLELKITQEEILPAIEKYYEFNTFVNTEQCWNEAEELKKYKVILDYVDKTTHI